MKSTLKRGYFGIGVYQMKNNRNLGTLWRSAVNMNADFIFVIGKRFKKERYDTVKSYDKIPMYEYETYEDFYNNIPYSCQLICIEQSDRSIPLSKVSHPLNCVYLLGSEDGGLPEKILKNKPIVHITSKSCLNVAVAGSIIMYDRQAKELCNV